MEKRTNKIAIARSEVYDEMNQALKESQHSSKKKIEELVELKDEIGLKEFAVPFACVGISILWILDDMRKSFYWSFGWGMLVLSFVIFYIGIKVFKQKTKRIKQLRKELNID